MRCWFSLCVAKAPDKSGSLTQPYNYNTQLRTATQYIKILITYSNYPKYIYTHSVIIQQNANSLSELWKCKLGTCRTPCWLSLSFSKQIEFGGQFAPVERISTKHMHLEDLFWGLNQNLIGTFCGRSLPGMNFTSSEYNSKLRIFVCWSYLF